MKIRSILVSRFEHEFRRHSIVVSVGVDHRAPSSSVVLPASWQVVKVNTGL